MKRIKKFLLLAVCFSLVGCVSNKQNGDEGLITKLVENDKIKIGSLVEETKSPEMPIEVCKELPKFSKKDKPWSSWDLTNKDISSFDLSNNNDVFDSMFDSNTVFPKELPEGFDPIDLMEKGKNPGLGIKKLHEQGITGKGVTIAIIDQPLLLTHESIKDNMKLYELIDSHSGIASMNGVGMASIAVGKDNGIAPDAKVYYISVSTMKMKDGKVYLDDSFFIDGIKRVLEYNEVLDENDKIKVISIGYQVTEDSENYQEIIETIQQAKEKGVFVITPYLEKDYGITLYDLDRDMSKDLDDYRSYTFATGMRMHPFDQSGEKILNIPTDHVTYAGYLSDHDYVFSANGGSGRIYPWLTGMYALCLQVDPELSGKEFLNLAMDTGYQSTVQLDGKEYTLSKIINPSGMIEALKEAD